MPSARSSAEPSRRTNALVLAVAALAMVGTLPGRTQGLGLITEPLLADLNIDRVVYASVNFWATIIGAAGAIGVGKVLDRFGPRAVLGVVTFALGLIVCLMSQARSLTELALLMTLTRGVGQSALSVVSIAMIGRWFVSRVDGAMAIYSIALSVGFMIAFPVVGVLVQMWGWRLAWLAVGIVLAAGLAPVALMLPPGGSDGSGVWRDPAPNEVDANDAAALTWRQAIGTSAFWIFGFGAALYGLVASGIGLFNESILAERGFGATVYYQTLAVTAITALAGNFLGGYLAMRVSLTRLMAAALLILSGGVAVMPVLSSIAQVMMWAVAMGIGGGLVMVLFFSVWPRVFGRRHLGQIQGIAQALTVVASALGPVLLAWCVDATGSYSAMFLILAAVTAATAATALIVDLPTPEIYGADRQAASS